MTSEAPTEDLISETDQDTPPPPPFHAVVNAELFRRVQLAVSTEKTRYYLNGVYIEPCPKGGAIMVATTGSILVCVRDPDAVVKNAGIVSLNKLMIRALKAERSDLTHTERALLIDYTPDHGSRALVASLAAESRSESRELAFELFDEPTGVVHAAQYGDAIIDGSYPDYKRVIPSYEECGQAFATFNPNYLKPIAAALAPLGKLQPALTFYTHKDQPESSPIIVRGSKFPLPNDGGWFDGLGIIMPCRGATDEGSAPPWLTQAA